MTDRDADADADAARAPRASGHLARPDTARPWRCDMCRSPVASAEAIVPEAANDLVRFCGLACHAAWRELLPIATRLADPAIGE